MILRQIEKDDLETIHHLIKTEWYQDLYHHNQKIANSYVHFDVNSCLMASSFGQVAEIDGQVVGVIMGSVEGEERSLSLLAQDPLSHLIELLSAPEDVRLEIVSQHNQEVKVNQQLLKTSPVSYEGEIHLLILSKDVRGKGIGSKLFKSMLNYFDKHHINHFCLFTDDSCGVEFYNKIGLNQQGIQNINPDDKVPFHYYLYDNT